MMAQGADGHVGGGSLAMSPEEVERRRQILLILDQGERDIASGNGSDWADVKQRMRDRISARTR